MLIKHILRSCQAPFQQRFNCFGGTLTCLVEIVLRFLLRYAKHEIYHAHPSGRTANTRAHSQEIARTALFDDGLQAVVARMPAALLHLHSAWVDIKLVMDNDKLFNRTIVFFAKLRSGPTGKVHEALGLRQNYLFDAAIGMTQFAFTHQSTARVLPVGYAPFAGQKVYHLKARVMARMRVFFPWVAQANYYAHALQGELWVEQRSNRLVVVYVVDSTCQKRSNGNNVDLAGLLFLRNNNSVANY